MAGLFETRWQAMNTAQRLNWLLRAGTEWLDARPLADLDWQELPESIGDKLGDTFDG